MTLCGMAAKVGNQAAVKPTRPAPFYSGDRHKYPPTFEIQYRNTQRSGPSIWPSRSDSPSSWCLMKHFDTEAEMRAAFPEYRKNEPDYIELRMVRVEIIESDIELPLTDGMNGGRLKNEPTPWLPEMEG